MRSYSIHFLTQEEPPDGDHDKREIMKACPSFGYLTFQSDAETQTGVLKDFKAWIGDQTMDDFYSYISFPNWKEENGETVQA